MAGLDSDRRSGSGCRRLLVAASRGCGRGPGLGDPASGARCLALAAHVRALPDPALHALLARLPRDRYDQLLEAAYRPAGTAA
jgi:hypothetical protein